MKNSQYMSKSNELCNSADTLREKCAYKQAICEYLNAILSDRNNPKLYLGLGICYKHLGKYTKAIDALEKTVQLDEFSYDAYYELGICNLFKGFPCKAIKCFVNAVKLNPNSADAILQLGISHELCEEYDMALMIYQKLIENSPEYIKAYDHKSSLLMKMNRYKEASNILSQIMKKDSNYYKAYFGIGVCFDKLGKKADAQRYYRKFLISKPNSEHASFVKDRMQKIRLCKSSSLPYALV